MKRFVFFLIAFGMAISFVGCISDQYENPSFPEINQPSSSKTRGEQNPTTFMDDKGIEIAKADIIGAYEGALRGFDYATNQNLSKDDALTIIFTSALLHAIARSHQAYVNYDRFHSAIEMASSDESMNISLPSISYTQSQHENLIRLSESKLVLTELNNWKSIDEQLYIQYPNEVTIGRKHNANLSLLKNNVDMYTLPTYETIIASMSSIKVDFITSKALFSGISNTIMNPFKFYNYDSITDSTSHYQSKRIITRFMEKMSTQGRSIRDYQTIMRACNDSVSNLPSLSEMEKESIYIGTIVGNFSMRYWAQ